MFPDYFSPQNHIEITSVGNDINAEESVIMLINILTAHMVAYSICLYCRAAESGPHRVSQDKSDGL